MKYNGTIYRPPIEAYTFLLPVTEGCTHNSCTFCNMYKDIPFRLLSLKEIEEYILQFSELYGIKLKTVERIFLVGGNPFALAYKHQKEIIDLIKSYMPKCSTISMYSSVNDVKNKTDEDLIKLEKLGINDLYVGIESGVNDVLYYLNKGHNIEEAIIQMNRLNKYGIRHNDMLMPGAAGKGRGVESGLKNAELLNKIKPSMILLTTMSVFSDTELSKEIEKSNFTPAGEKEILIEEKTLLENLDLPETYFITQHVLNSVQLHGYLKNKQDEMIETMTNAINTIDEDKFEREFQRHKMTHL